MPTIAIIGASGDRSKFGNKAVRIFASSGFRVYPVNPKEKLIEGHKVYSNVLELPEKNLDMISVYLPPAVTLKVLADIAKVGCKKLWLNPGAESPEVMEKAKALGLPAIAACSIVGIGRSPSEAAD